MIEGLLLDENGKLKIPEDKKRIKFDVGLSWDAPNSSLWLNREKDLFVIGVEPNKEALRLIKVKGGVWSMAKRRGFIKVTEDNYMLLECAIDNIDEPTTAMFYSMSSTDPNWEGCPGCSSLLEPTTKLYKNRQEVSSTAEVNVVPFSYILDKVPWDRFPYIDLVKTDCQGKDFEVIKSMGDYLSKVVYLNCELSTFGNYKDETNTHEFISYLTDRGFRRISRRHGEFVNEVLIGVAVQNNISNKCMNI